MGKDHRQSKFRHREDSQKLIGISAQHRHDIILKIYKLMLENNDDLARIIVSLIAY